MQSTSTSGRSGSLTRNKKKNKKIPPSLIKFWKTSGRETTLFFYAALAVSFPLVSPGRFVCFKIKWISFFICHYSFFCEHVGFVTKKKKKEMKNRLFDSTLFVCLFCFSMFIALFDSTLYEWYNPVQVCGLYGMTRYESFTHTSLV